MSHVRTLLAGTAVALTGVAVLSTASPVLADGGGRPLSTRLSGATEVPRPGDPDGTGTASLRVNPGQGEICYELTVSGIEPARAAHIHEAPAGEAGPVVVGLEAPTDGSSDACVTVTRELARDIIRNPADYYVNVHNAPFPGGALRGQLG
jgi:hypothetical protein